jgi:hypothetical protein
MEQYWEGEHPEDNESDAEGKVEGNYIHEVSSDSGEGELPEMTERKSAADLTSSVKVSIICKFKNELGKWKQEDIEQLLGEVITNDVPLPLRKVVGGCLQVKSKGRMSAQQAYDTLNKL